MSGKNRSSDRAISRPGWGDSSIRYIRYGITLIRQDGLAYFIRKLVQFTGWRVMGAYQSARAKFSTSRRGELIEIDDVHLSPPHQLDAPALNGSEAVPSYHDGLIQLGIACRKQTSLERQGLTEQGRRLYSGRRVLFVSPIRVMGGGANLILQAAEAMQHMGVHAQLLNLNVHRAWFENNYRGLKLPVIFTEVEDIPRQAQSFDAVIATSNPTVGWIAPAKGARPDLVMGYYIQDYEPYFYAPGTHEIKRATASYTLIPNLVRMVTTPWIASQVQSHHNVQCAVVGGHIDPALFQPRPRTDPSWPDRPLRITAMIRPTTPRRNPRMTMAVLQQISKIVSSRVQIRLFGCDRSDPGFASLDQDFPWQLAGELRSTQVARLFNEADIFVDFSDFQAFGVTAVEAMACGMAVIVPANGGTNAFARNGENCLIVDTHDQLASFEALKCLIEDDALRLKLQTNAVSEAASFYAEIPAFKILKALFPEGL